MPEPLSLIVAAVLDGGGSGEDAPAAPGGDAAAPPPPKAAANQVHSTGRVEQTGDHEFTTYVYGQVLGSDESQLSPQSDEAPDTLKDLPPEPLEAPDGLKDAPPLQANRSNKPPASDPAPPPDVTDQADAVTEVIAQEAEPAQSREPDPQVPSTEKPDQDLRVTSLGQVDAAGDLHRLWQDQIGQARRANQILRKGVDDDFDAIEDPGFGDVLWAATKATLIDVVELTESHAASVTAPLTLGESVGEKGISGLPDDVLKALEVIPSLKSAKTAVNGVQTAVQLGKATKAAAPAKKVVGYVSKKSKDAALKLKRKAKNKKMIRESRKAVIKKLGHPSDFVYGKGKWWGDHIQPYDVLKRTMKGNGLQQHHILPKSILGYGPKKTKGLMDYVPSVPLEGREHLKATHGALNKFLKDGGIDITKLSSRAPLSDAEVRKAMTLTKLFYREKGLNHFVEAISEFQKRAYTVVRASP